MKNNLKFSSILFFLFLISYPSDSNSSMISTVLEISDESLLNENKEVTGKMKINGESYTAICDCDHTTPEATNKMKLVSGPLICDPKNMTFKMEEKGEGASLDQIKKLVGEVDDLTYVQASYTSFKCLDGRHSQAVLSVPGGDAGEFISALSTFENLIQSSSVNQTKITKLTKEDITYLFKEYLRVMLPETFSMCTDYNSILQMERDMEYEGLNIKKPRAGIMEKLKEQIILPENTGDSHLRLMLKYPDLYGIRKDLVEDFIKVFYETLWADEGAENSVYSSKLNLDILKGEHQESAFVEVRSNDSCQHLQLAPLIKTKDKNISVFVDHLDAVSFLRENLSKFFSDKAKMYGATIDKEVMHKRLNHHGFINLEITGSYIAKGLPFDSITIA